MKHLMARIATLMLTLTAAGSVHAQCAGFTDVVDDGTGPTAFCPSVQWLKNRAITLGCTSTTLYCPTGTVTRLAMAAFMNRLGKALTPEILYVQGSPGAITIPGNSPVPAEFRCVTDDTAATVYPRQALVSGVLSGFANGTVSWRGWIGMSTDGGVTWTDANPGITVGIRTSSGPDEWSNITAVEKVNLEPNVTYRFAVGMRRDDVAPANTGNFTASRCQVAATIHNRDGAGPPYDSQ